jgi:hypothetical protein
LGSTRLWNVTTSSWLALWSASATALAAPPDDSKRHDTPPERRETSSTPPDRARGLEREDAPRPDDVALAVPRALLFVPRMAIRYALLPVRAAVTWAGRNTAAESGLEDPSDRSTALWPELSHQSWFGPTLGLHAGYRNLAGHDEQLALSARMLGEVRWGGSASFFGDHIGGSLLWLSTSTLLEQRGRDVFAGIGDRPGPIARYAERRAIASVGGGPSFGGGSRRTRVGAIASLVNRDFSSDADGRDELDAHYLPASLRGFTTGVRLVEADALLEVDTRNATARPSDGTSLRAFAGAARPTSGDTYGHLGADYATTFDLFQSSRLLNLRLHYEAVFAADGIPFSELPRLGGPVTLRGYALGWLRDRAALSGELEYVYQVHAAVDGAVFTQIGRVGRDTNALFDRQPWHPSAGFGLRVRTETKSFFSLDLAYGDGLAFYLTTIPGGTAP